MQRKNKKSPAENGTDTSETNNIPQQNMKKNNSQKVTQNSVSKSETLIRIVSGIAMAGAFIFLCSKSGHVGLEIFVLILQIISYYEFINLRYKKAKEKEVPYFRTIQWLLFFGVVFYLYGGDFALSFAHRFPLLGVLYHFHGYLSTVIFVALFILIVYSLKPSSIKYQMGQISWTCLSISIILLQAKSIYFNIRSGTIWFFIPIAAVIWNDVTAFFGGKLLGHKIFKERLIDLSPNKTWEGFYTGLIFTPILCGITTYFAVQYPIMFCPSNNLACEPSFPFVDVTYKLPYFLQCILRRETIDILPFYIHMFFFSIFASIASPFGGFFASGVKRAYMAKDFGDILPGHGGVMDRLDCQFMMAMYVTAHYSTFVKPYLKQNLVPKVMELFYQLSLEDQNIVSRTITDYILSIPQP